MPWSGEVCYINPKPGIDALTTYDVLDGANYPAQKKENKERGHMENWVQLDLIKLGHNPR